MPSCEEKSRLIVFCESKSGRTVSVQRVTTLAGVKVGSHGELTGMLITVAIGAMLKLDLEQCVLALGNMALFASHGCMLALQRISRWAGAASCSDEEQRAHPETVVVQREMEKRRSPIV